ARNLVGTSEHPGAVVVVDKDRFKGGNYATATFGVDTIILDDGFQYLRLRPWTNILLVDSTNPFHNHEQLPVGMLREPIQSLERADFIFLTKSDGRASLHHLRKFLRRHNPQAEIIARQMKGGSTLGHLSLVQIPFPSADIGLAELAMHSAYETAGTEDVLTLVKVAKTFFE
ncbi:MAG: tetraacyldisaccharide 4'-kinase, partial [Candidatus Methanomethylophilaceae archaeon]|nr:tetraacyldisaccharide 4'-kinase [Candidatus Methanomethylophilaceae archaeon]